ncbi:MAG: glycosyltransferase family 4 protein [Coprobacter fastidiosus]
MITCLQVHNDYLIPGGETKSVKLIANVLEKNGIKVIRYYRDNTALKDAGIAKKSLAGIKSVYNNDTVKEIENILSVEHVDFALVHNTSPMISNSIYAVLIKHRIKIYKYMQNYNLVCLNGALDKGSECDICRNAPMHGVKLKCYKGSAIYSLQKCIAKDLLWKKYINDISGFIAISEYVKNRHAQLGIPKEKITVLYHFCEDKPRILARQNNEKYVVYMGRLSQEKGIITLIKAMQENPQVILKIMGKGPIEEELKAFVLKNKMSNIQFLGYKTGEEKNNIIGNAMALIAPSEWEEPFGRIAIEAYQVGTPVIASAIGGLKELIKSGVTGFLFDAGDVPQLENHIKYMSMKSDSELNIMRENCVKLAEEKFTEEAYFENFCSAMKLENK